MLDKILQHTSVMLFMAVLTMYAIFMDDVRMLTLHKDSDDIIFGITCWVMAMFILEIILSSIGIPDYFIGFYFWLDVIATFSLITDIDWIWNPIVGVQDFTAQNAN